MKSNLSIHGTMVRFDTFHPPSSHAIFHFSRVKSFRPPLPSPESGREALHFRSLTRAQPNAIFLSFFFLYIDAIYRTSSRIYSLQNFETFIFFFPLVVLSKPSACNKLRRTCGLASPLPSVDIARRTRDRDANSRMEKEGERWFTRSAINISGETPEVSPEERSWRGRWWLGERYRLHIVDPWLMYRLSYLQAVLSSPPIDPRSRYPFEIRDPEF